MVPVKIPSSFRELSDGNAQPKADENLRVLEDAGIKLGQFVGWCPDNCPVSACAFRIMHKLHTMSIKFRWVGCDLHKADLIDWVLSLGHWVVWETWTLRQLYSSGDCTLAAC